MVQFLAIVYDKPFTLLENIQWTGWFTVLSIVRSYSLRRIFNKWHR